MKNYDPTTGEMAAVMGEEKEWTVEEAAAQMGALEAEQTQAFAEQATGDDPVTTDGQRTFDLAPAAVIAEEATRIAEARGAALPALPREPLPRRPVLPLPRPIPWPIRPLPITKRAVSGRYRSAGVGFQLELRVDVDGRRPMTRISGDFYQVSGATVSYFGSFVVNSPSISVTTTMVTITGMGAYTFAASHPRVRVQIPRVWLLSPPSPATVQFLNLANHPGAAYNCPFQSPYFRTVQYEQDCATGVTPLTSYNTGSLPSGGPARALSVPAAYAEAGIEMQTAGAWNVVSTAGVGPSWSNAELHAAMQTQFSLWREAPQWKVWLLAADLHDYGSGLYGIMFDQQGKQRQGCATFHRGIGGTTADKLRLQLYTYVHELGHCFNLLHSWQKSYAVPPVPNRPTSLSWMNYPWNYPGGANAFWSAFPFQFDNEEVIHLRHAFRNNVVMGGNNFAVGAALQDPQAFADLIEDNSGLLLELEAPKRTFAYGEPVVVEVKLRTTDTRRGKRVQAHLHPNMGFTQIGIRKPSGEVMVYEPLMEHCVADKVVTLSTDNPAIYDSAFIGYGKGGVYFDQPGTYQLRALYHALDGSEVLSDIITIRVRHPVTAADEEVAELFLGDEQGTLLYLLGSDSEFLKSGNEALDNMLDKHGRHPLATYARLVKGINAEREFKTISPDKNVVARKPRHDECIRLLSAVADASEAAVGVDNITLNMTMRRLAAAEKAAGDDKGAKATMDRMLGIFRKKALKPHVLRLIEMQAAEM